jgi:cytochrome b6-f complex iron-sulfur subunit
MQPFGSTRRISFKHTHKRKAHMKESNVSRGEFLSQLGMGSKALMAFYCLGAVAACTTDEEPEPMQQNPPVGGNGNPGGGIEGVTGATSGSSVNFTVDLTNQSFSGLKTKGNFAYVDGIIIANANAGLVALSKVCTHTGTTVQYRKDENDIWCPNHGSEFSTSGTVEKGPAGSSLTVYSTTLSMDGNTLTVKI